MPSGNGFEKEQYEVTLGYLDHSGRQKLTFPVQVRERHLTPGPSDATLQGIGPELQIVVWSDRDNVLVRIPFTEWRATKPYSGKLTGRNNGQLSIGRFADLIPTVEAPDHFEGAGVAGFLWTFDMEKP